MLSVIIIMLDFLKLTLLFLLELQLINRLKYIF